MGGRDECTERLWGKFTWVDHDFSQVDYIFIEIHINYISHQQGEKDRLFRQGMVQSYQSLL